MIDGIVICSSDVQFYESQIVSVAPVTAHQHVPVAVPTPELSTVLNLHKTTKQSLTLCGWMLKISM